MEWVHGDIIGQGTYATVRLARPKKQGHKFPEIMAVKSSRLCHAKMLLHERSILGKLENCPHIIRCFGKDYTRENGEKIYNLFLEYASGGTLADKLKKHTNSRLEESEVRRYTKSLVEGMKYIHEKGYVHRDLKLENLLVCSGCKDDETLKIADFGLARRFGKRKKREVGELGGTFLYLSPEAISRSEQEPPADVGAIGCLVAEMFTGVEVWQPHPREDTVELLMRMASEMPEIPVDLSSEGRDFLSKIFIKDPAKRWTAKMLLDHPFIVNVKHRQESATSLPSSPRGPLDWIDGYESLQSTCSVTGISSGKVNSGSQRLSMAKKFKRFVTCQG